MKRQINLAIMAISLVLFSGWPTLARESAAGNKAWDEYINNSPESQNVKNLLVGGMFTSQKDIENFIRDNPYNPVTGETWDMAVAFGMSPNGTPMPVVFVFEAGRVVTDNLSFSPFTNYEKLRNIKAEYVVSHSNGNDIAFNAIKYGYVQSEHWVMISPPSGYQGKVNSMIESEVKDIKIFHTQGDMVVSTFGKNLLPGLSPLGKWFDVRIGLNRDGSEFFWGARVDIPLGEGKRLHPSSIQEFQFKKKESGDLYFNRSDGKDIYFTDYPHALKWEFNNVALFYMNKLDKAYHRNPTKSSMTKIEHELLDYCKKFPEAKNKFFENWSQAEVHRSLPPKVMELVPLPPSQLKGEKSLTTGENAPPSKKGADSIANYWTYPGRPQSMTEVEVMTAFARGKERALVVGEGKEAKYLFQQLEKMLGAGRVRWVKDVATWQQEAANFRADVVLGVKSQSLPRSSPSPHGKEFKQLDEKKLSSPPPPPPPPGGGGALTSTRLPSTEYLGGVEISPQPESAGRGGGEIKKKILESRPKGDAPSWSAK